MLFFKDIMEEIKKYCITNSLDFNKVQNMCKNSGQNDLFLQYYDSKKGQNGLLDETPMPVVLYIKKEKNKFVFSQTEYTQKYLGLAN